MPIFQAKDCGFDPAVAGVPRCRHGHALDARNTSVDAKGVRRCRRCAVRRMLQWRDRNPRPKLSKEERSARLSKGARDSWAVAEIREKRVAAMRAAWDDPLAHALRLKPECRNGHAFTDCNTTFSADGKRQCKTCTRLRQRRWKGRQA